MSSTAAVSLDQPVFAVPEENLIPANNYLSRQYTIPPSRMFLIKKSLAVYRQNNPGSPVYDASQGDGGESLPGAPRRLLERAAQLQIEHGTAYDMPYGSDDFRRAVIEAYWQVDSDLGIGPANVLSAVGGRDALTKAYQAMLNLGHGRIGDAIITSRVPWISYNWGPYAVGANVLRAPGRPAEGWAFTPENIQETVLFAEGHGRKAAGIIITSPDNPTGATLTPERQAELGHAALEAGVAYVLYDWMYHYVTDEQPVDINVFLRQFSPAERARIMILDGLTKSLGGSNIRSAHLIAAEPVVKYIVANASHGVIPPYFAGAVAIAAYEEGYAAACKVIVEPTNASRQVLRAGLQAAGYQFILGQGYYAFINVGPWLEKAGWADSEPLGQYLGEQFGLAIVPGVYFSPDGGQWVRFSYATPPERTQGALERLNQGLAAL